MSARGPMLTRRALLGAAALSLAACRVRPKPAAPDPDAARLEVARTLEQQLLAASPAGSPAHTAHLAHLQALGGAPASSAGSAPTGESSALERDSVATLQAAANSAHSGRVAALLASLAASHDVLAAAGA